MSRSRLVVDAHAGMIVALVLVGAGTAWEARGCEWLRGVFRGDLR